MHVCVVCKCTCMRALSLERSLERRASSCAPFFAHKTDETCINQSRHTRLTKLASVKAHKTNKTCINQSRHTRLTKLASINQGTEY